MTAGDTTLDALVLLAVTGGLLLPLVVLAWPLEETERGRRFADWLSERIFPR
jgi:hypothetical protein